MLIYNSVTCSLLPRLIPASKRIVNSNKQLLKFQKSECSLRFHSRVRRIPNPMRRRISTAKIYLRSKRSRQRTA